MAMNAHRNDEVSFSTEPASPIGSNGASHGASQNAPKNATPQPISETTSNTSPRTMPTNTDSTSQASMARSTPLICTPPKFDASMVRRATLTTSV